MSFPPPEKNFFGINIAFFPPKKKKDEICWIPDLPESKLFLFLKKIRIPFQEIEESSFEVKMGKLKKKTSSNTLKDLKNRKKGDHCWTHFNHHQGETQETLEVKMGHLKKRMSSFLSMLKDTESVLSIEEQYDITKDDFDSQIIQISWEATPSTDINCLNHIADFSFSEQRKYLETIMAALESNEDGDIVSRKIGLNTKKIMIGHSAWQGKVGAGVQTFVEVEVERDGMNIDVIPSHKKLLNLYSALMGYLLRQDAVIWYFKNPNVPSNQEQLGIEAKFHYGLNASEFREAYNAIYLEFQTWNLAPGFTDEGFIVVNYDDSIDNEVFQDGMKKVLSNLRKNKIGKGLRTKTMFKFVGEYISNDWLSSPKGDQYFEWIPEDFREWVRGIREKIDKINKEFERRNEKNSSLKNEEKA